ncbi:reverse transcriptase [Corchorus capsularis]|uniref:Reverse transcriptase n=1 Tax=Corchorus capsularis TaxID=210143 RepID=A0A1R3HL41_COCAP|nr:reverse transcriptase [Corchorus capsularis]
MEIDLECGSENGSGLSKFVVIGRIIADRVLNRKGVKAILRNIWPETVAPCIREIGDNKYSISFKKQDAMERAIADANAERIGNKIGRLIEIEDPSMVGFGKGYLRIRVALPILESLVDGFWVPKENGDRIWAVVKYERLMDFCFNCGRLGHVLKFCGAELLELPRFGPQMRALPPRRGFNRLDSGFGGSIGAWEDDEVNSARGSQKHWEGENSIGLSRSDGLTLGRVQGSMLKDDIQGTNWKDRLEERKARDRALSKGISHSLSLHSVAEKNIYVKDVTGDLRLVRDTENFMSKNSNVVLKILEPNETGVLESKEREEFCADNDQLNNVLEELGNFNAGDNREKGTYELEKYVVESPLVGEQIAGNNNDVLEDGQNWALVEYDGKGCQSLEVVNSELSADLRKLKIRKGREDGNFDEVSKKKQKVEVLKEINVVETACQEVLFSGKGAGSPLTRNVLKGMVKDHDPDVIFLMETKNGFKKMECLRKGCKMDNSLYIDPEGLSGGLALWWKGEVNVQVITGNKNVIDTKFVCSDTGDFNDIMVGSEKEGGRSKERRLMDNFVDFINDCGLNDIKAHGPLFTWMGIGEGEVIFNLEALGSDHAPILVDTDYKEEKAPRRFKFEATWLTYPDCMDVVRKGWGEQVDGTMAFKFMRKLQKCRSLLIQWCKDAVQNNKKVISNLKKEVASLKEQAQTEEDYKVMQEIVKRVKEAWHREENGDGSWSEKEDQVIRSFADYYDTLFRTDGRRDWGDILDCVPQLVTREMNEELVKEISNDEIRDAVFQLGAYKAPGPDGFSGIFYQRCWNVIKKDVCEVVRSFFRSGRMLRELNRTDIVLIPKIKGPTSVSHFRPINLCNFIYKVISKVMVNRMQPFLGELISEQQSAFVAQRMIHDNILIANEAFHHMRLKKRGRKYEVAMKLDMNKAYDRVEWDFLRSVLLKLGFDPLWVSWILECVSTVSYSLILNGKQAFNIFPSRGLRQGDPLSPYLFLFVVDVLSRSVQQKVLDGSISGIQLSRQSPMLTHLFFADDSLFFFDANLANCRNMISCVQDYCRASGQSINMENSRLIFSSNVPEDERQQVENCLGIKVAANPGTYLGIPTFWGKSKYDAMGFIKEKVLTKLKSWKQQTLSYGGREVMIKAVASAMPVYVMACYKLPKRLCDDINSAMAKREGCDKLKWIHAKDGNYTVKSGYQVMKQVEVMRNNQVPTSSYRINVDIWKYIWNLKIPSKLQVFMWRLCHNAVATMYNLWKRRLKDNPLCPICFSYEETVEHMIVQCDWTRGIWFAVLGIRVVKEHIIHFEDWLLDIHKQLQESGKDCKTADSLIAYVCWSIWLERCAVSFGLDNGNVLVDNLVKDTEVNADGKQSWQKPEFGWLKINCDGAFIKETHKAGIGVVVRDSGGRLLDGACESVKANSAEMVEAYALKKGVELAVQRKFDKVVFETYCRTVYTGVTDSKTTCNWQIGPIVQEIRFLMQQIPVKKFKWIRRTCNAAAHWATSEAVKGMCNLGWLRLPPSSLMFILDKDGLPAPPPLV